MYLYIASKILNYECVAISSSSAISVVQYLIRCDSFGRLVPGPDCLPYGQAEYTANLRGPSHKPLLHNSRHSEAEAITENMNEICNNERIQTRIYLNNGL